MALLTLLTTVYSHIFAVPSFDVGKCEIVYHEYNRTTFQGWRLHLSS